MDKPADPATPFREVYQHFLATLATRRRKQSTLAKCLYDYRRFERWLRQTGRPVTFASLMGTDILFAYRQYVQPLSQQARGSIRRRRSGMMSNRMVHSYLRGTKCLASWLTKNGFIPVHPFLAADPYAGDQPEDLRDRALVWTLHSAGTRAGDAANVTIPEVDLSTGILDVEDGKGDKDRQAFVQKIAAGYPKAYLERGRTQLLERMPERRGPVPAGETNLPQ